MPKIDPICPTDDVARGLARQLIDSADTAALGVLDPDTGAPMVTRIAVATDADGVPVTLVSDLSAHTAALRAAPDCGLLLGEPGTKGDPLTHPRISLSVRAAFVDQGSDDHATLRARYLDLRPKAKLYIDFGDFRFVRFDILSAALNGGFGQAFRLSAGDLTAGRG